MHREVKYIILITVIAVSYFATTFFALAAFVPGYALAGGLIAAMLAMTIYFLLLLVGKDEVGLPLGLLILFPIVCATAGVIWWTARLVGLWQPLR